MIQSLLVHQWAQFRRSASFERELGIIIFIAIISFVAFIFLLSLAFALPKFVHKIPGVTDPIWFINQVMVYFFCSEFMMRYFLQKVPVLDVQPYLGLPIKRKLVAGFLIGKSLLSPFNILSLVLTIPFVIKIVVPQMGTIASLCWLVGIFSISICIHFLTILFKKKLEDKPLVWIFLITLATSNYVARHFYGIDIFKPFASSLLYFLYHPIFALIPVVGALALTFTTNHFYRQNLYLEELTDQQQTNVENFSDRLGFLGRGSLSDVLLLQEIKMIIRHKRTRSVLVLSLIFVAYGLIFFRKGEVNNGALMFLGVFMSGSFAINYGQFFWSWNTNQLDFFLTKPLAIITWLKSRYNLLVAASVVTSLLTIPYVYFGWKVLLCLIACSFYNIGINIPLMMRLSIWGPKPIDLNKGAFMNYEGTGAAQWVMGLPLILGPFIFYVPFNILINHVAGLLAVGIAGIIGFVFRDYFIKLLAKKMNTVKYKLIHELTL